MKKYFFHIKKYHVDSVHCIMLIVFIFCLILYVVVVVGVVSGVVTSRCSFLPRSEIQRILVPGVLLSLPVVGVVLKWIYWFTGCVASYTSLLLQKIVYMPKEL